MFVGSAEETKHLKISVLEPHPPSPSETVKERVVPGIRVSAITMKTKKVFEGKSRSYLVLESKIRES